MRIFSGGARAETRLLLPNFVMAGSGPAIHDFSRVMYVQDVDARIKFGHDDLKVTKAAGPAEPPCRFASPLLEIDPELVHEGRRVEGRVLPRC
jgi:hypothetical protein